jgi:hypothetical protein
MRQSYDEIMDKGKVKVFKIQKKQNKQTHKQSKKNPQIIFIDITD